MFEPPYPHFPRMQTAHVLMRQPAIMDEQFWDVDQAVFADVAWKNISFRQLLHRLIRDYHHGLGVYWMGIDLETRKVLGVLALTGDFQKGHCSLHLLSYQPPFGQTAWEAVFKELLHFAFYTLKLRSISSPSVDAQSSWDESLERLGFENDGLAWVCHTPNLRGG